MTTEPTIIEKEVNSANEYTSIRISKRTLDRLGRLGHFKETWDDVIERIAAEKLGLSVPEGERSF